jgi:hypothetical protein
MSGSLSICLVALLSGCSYALTVSSVELHAVEKIGSERGSVFMLVAGMSAPEELCLQVLVGTVHLDSCHAAIAAADGRELWSFQAAGQLMHVTSKKCAEATQQGVGLADCNGASTWTLLPHGQLQVGGLCLSQSGEAAGGENVAHMAAASATSSANLISHGASAAVDSDAATYWASKFDEDSPTTFTLDLGEQRSASSLKISWAFPPMSFSVETSADGSSWVEVFATTVNMDKITLIPLGLSAVSGVRVIMQAPHPVYGKISGHSVYGISTFSVKTTSVKTVLDDCSSAAESKDARDKYFLSYTSDYDASPLAMLQAELPALHAAKASLSMVLGELAKTSPQLAGCKGTLSLQSDVQKHSEAEVLSELAALGLRERSGLEGVSDMDTVGLERLLARELVSGFRRALI